MPLSDDLILLGRTKGRAEVSLEGKSALIEFDPAKTGAAALIEAVEDGGFDAAL